MKAILRKTLPLLAFLTAGSCLFSATDAALVDLLVRRGVITAEEAQTLEVAPNQPINARLLQLLVNNGALSAEDVASLESAPAEAATPAISAESGVITSRSTVPAPKVGVEESTTVHLAFSGRIQAQGDFLRTDYDSVEDPDHEANLFIRRLYFGATAELTDTITGEFNANFGDGASGIAEVEKALIQWDIDDFHRLEVGYRKVPFGYEETTSSAKLKTVERSVPTRYFVDQLEYASRFTGLYLGGEYDSGFYFNTALTNPEQGTVNGSAEANTLAAWAQAGWKLDFAGLPWDVGVSGGRLEDVREPGMTDWVWGVHAATGFSDLEFVFEYLSGRLENAGAGGGDANPLGLSLQGAWKLTPRLELVGRVSSLDADGGVGADLGTTSRRAPINGEAAYDKTEAFYLGGNWYFHGNAVKLSAGYEWAEYEDNLTGAQGDAVVDGFRTRLQLLY